MIQASAPAKAILFGEHAVVYGQPGIAVPLTNLRTTVTIHPIASDLVGIRIVAADIGQSFWLHERDDRDPLAYAVRLALADFQIPDPAPFELTIASAIPVASGLGSGAAASVAIIRALAKHFKLALNDQRISQIAFEVEKLHHGTPSGIDNTVVTLEQPLIYRRGAPAAPFSLPKPVQVILAHSGVSSQTGEQVQAVRERWEATPTVYNALFKSIGSIVELAYRSLMGGELDEVGRLMDSNHALLQDLGVSTEALDQLVACARSAGASGAKLSGAGGGGFMLALVEPEQQDAVVAALERAGSKHVFSVKVSG